MLIIKNKQHNTRTNLYFIQILIFKTIDNFFHYKTTNIFNKRNIIKYPILILYCLISCTAFAFNNQKIKILCSTYPIYLITKNIINNNPNFTTELLIPSQTGCPHDYFTTIKDLQKIASSQVLIINGAGLDDFLLKLITNKIDPTHELTIINATQHIKEILYKKSHSGKIPNPHLFTSPILFKKMISQITKNLSLSYPKEKNGFQKNALIYLNKIDKISFLFQSLKNNIKNKFIVTGHDAFDYLAYDLNLTIIGTLNLEHNQPLTVYQINDIIARIKKFNIKTIFIEPQYSNKNLSTITQETNTMIQRLDPVTTGPINPPLNYYEIVMLKNYYVHKKTIGVK